MSPIKRPRFGGVFLFALPQYSPIQAAIIPPATRWSVSQRRNTSSAYQIPDAAPGRYTGQRSRPIIIRYIKAHRLLWIHARRRNIPQTMPRPAACDLALGQPGTLHPAGQSSSLERSGRRGTIGGYRRISFRAFAR